MGKSHWRDIARRIIHKVLQDNINEDEKTIKKALKEAYPFGARRWYPYKIWLDEIKVQRKTKKKKGEVHNPDQTKLF